MSKYKNKSFINKLSFAINGLKYAFSLEKNLRIHVITALLVLTLAIILNVTTIEFCILVLICTIVITLEMINTNIELLVDIFNGSKFNEQVKTIKDIAAGTVLVAAIASVVIGTVILWKYIINIILK